jgi:hypothetical protein
MSWRALKILEVIFVGRVLRAINLTWLRKTLPLVRKAHPHFLSEINKLFLSKEFRWAEPALLK